MSLDIPSPFSVFAIQARMGAWTYYTATIPLSEIAQRVRSAAEIHEARTLRDMVQRSLTKRSSLIADYLCNHDYRFFNSIVIGCYAGAPEWVEVSLDEDQIKPLLLDHDPIGVTGVLKFTGTEVMFAIDGQHRVAGIKQAITREEELGNEWVSVIFVPAVVYSASSEQPEGFRRTRQLFTHLNRYAKPVGKKDIIALDEDHITAIIVRRIVDDYKPLKEKIALTNVKSLSRDDMESLTNIITLFDFFDGLFSKWHGRGWIKYTTQRPDDSTLDEYYDRATKILKLIGTSFDEIQYAYNAEPNSSFAGRYRYKGGGHLLYRPVGWNILKHGLQSPQFADFSQKKTLNRLNKISWNLEEPPWRNLLFNPETEKMQVSLDRQRLAKAYIDLAFGGQFRPSSKDQPRYQTKKDWTFLATIYQDVTGVKFRKGWEKTIK